MKSEILLVDDEPHLLDACASLRSRLPILPGHTERAAVIATLPVAVDGWRALAVRELGRLEARA